MQCRRQILGDSHTLFDKNQSKPYLGWKIKNERLTTNGVLFINFYIVRLSVGWRLAYNRLRNGEKTVLESPVVFHHKVREDLISTWADDHIVLISHEPFAKVN